MTAKHGGPLCPVLLFFLGNYILYGVLVLIFMYIPINHVCMAIFRLYRFPPAALWRHFWPKWRHFGQNRLHKQSAIVSVKMVGWTWKLVSILVSMFKSKNRRKISWLMFLCLFLETPLFYCLQTIENNRKSMKTIDFRKYLHTFEKYHHFMSTDQIWCY